MDILRGKMLLVGRDAESGRLTLAMSVGTSMKMAKIGDSDSVPGSVSRCVPQQNAAHAKIEIDSAGAMRITNLKAANVTFVNGTEIMTKGICNTDRIELGRDHYVLNLSAVLEAAGQIARSTGMASQTFSISHLESVWSQYKDVERKIVDDSKRTALWGRVPLMVSMGTGVLTGVSGALGLGKSVTGVCLSLTILGLLLFIYSFIRAKNDKSQERKEQNIEWLMDHYLCPNPACRKFLGVTSYKLLIRNTGLRCPHCKCNWEK